MIVLYVIYVTDYITVMISQQMKERIKKEIIVELKNDKSFRKAMATLLIKEFDNVELLT